MNWKIILTILGISATIFLLSFNLNNQTLNNKDRYKSLWKKVTQHEKDRLPKSAKEIVDKIYDLAAKENNAPQRIKALIHQFKYIQQLERVENPEIFKLLEKEIAISPVPTKNVLHSMMAELYWQYLQQNRHRYYNRTETVAFDNDDILTWSLEKIYKTIIDNHNKALENDAIIKRTAVSEFEDIIDLAENKDKALNTRPTLYDFIANRAIDFFKNDESAITKPIYTFVLNEESVFSETGNFINQKYSSKDELSNKLFALKIYQALESFHKTDNSKFALIESNLKRLEFAHNNAILSNKDQLYENALLTLLDKNKNNEASVQVSYYLAKHYLQISNKYNAFEKPEFGKYKKMAREVCNKAISNFPNSFFSKDCQSLLGQIESKVLNFQIEDANNVNENLRALVDYQNISNIYCKVVKLNKEDYQKIENNDIKRNNLLSFLNQKQSVKRWNYNLPSSEDLLKHNTEIKIDALNPGYYYLMISDNPNFSTRNNAVAFHSFWVTKYAIVEKNFRGEFNFYVVDRKTGSPLEQVKLDLYQRNYDRKKRAQVYNYIQSVTSNKEGIAYAKGQGRYQHYRVEVDDQNDFYTINTNISNYDHTDHRRAHTQVNFFTDRSIYRPGQKVYFKAISYETFKNKHTLQRGKSYTVKFLDANYQKIKEQTFITNEFGSFNGSFLLPETGLTGIFTIQTEGGRSRISVEEYKRPKFEVTFDTIKESYSLNEYVNLKGNAISYSGANLDNVKVEYIVERKASFPYWWGWWCGIRPPYSAEKMIITQGETSTDENGKFNIKFLAKPDMSLSEESKPIFNYTVTAKVIDSTGETQEKTTSLKAGYIALDVNMTTPETVTKGKEASISVSTKNLNNAFESADLDIKISRLREPDRLMRKRYWQRPDQFVFSEKDYISYFKNDIYDNEDKFYEWGNKKSVLNKNERSTKNYKLKLRADNWEAGKYKVVLNTKDKNNKAIEIIQYFNLVDERSQNATGNQYFNVMALNKKVIPGETAKLLVNTAADKLHLHFYKEVKNELINTNYDLLSKTQKIYTENVSDMHIGDFVMAAWTVINNRYYEKAVQYEVPFPSKELKFEWQSFRDKLQPNENEEWRLKIYSDNKEQIAAELLATMYDASLDAFKPHQYNFNLHHIRNHSKLQLMTQSFRSSRSILEQKDWNERSYMQQRTYDRFNWQGFSIYRIYYQNDYVLDAVETKRGGLFKSKANRAAPQMEMDAGAPPPPSAMIADNVEIEEAVIDVADDTFGNSMQPESQKTDFSNVQVRGKLVETAFFKPDLKTDRNGNIIISFKSPETLTKWKVLGFGHNTQLDFGLFEKELRTQKDLMITPNAPRFFRENDKITFTAKVNNISDRSQTGVAVLQLFDATTDEPIDGNFNNSYNERSFSIEAGRSKSFEWKLDVPDNIEAVTYKVIAKAGNLSDGEQNSLPVLKNRMMVTETMPLPLRSNQTKTFVFDKFRNNNSSSLQNYSYTLEFTSNPAWYAVQALPYLMDYPNDCAEQIFSRIYANSLASEIANSQPKIKAIFDEWKSKDSEALISNLEKNQELKMLLLEETPWVMEAKNETERKKRIALLFDLNKMSKEYKNDVKKLLQLQKSDGGFGWFNGMRSNRYITQHIVTGFGKLDHLNVKAIKQDQQLYNAIKNAIDYLDRQVRDDYRNLKRSRNVKLSDFHLSNIHLHYLYSRSFFKDVSIPSDTKVAFDYYLGQAEKYWTKFGFYQQGLIAMALHRNNKYTKGITNSLRENTLEDEELGMFYKYPKGYYWYQAPIESQAMMIEVFSEIENDTKMVDGLKVWLLKQKQVQDWKTTKATVEAIYALLLKGSDWLAEDEQVKIKLNGKKYDPFKNSNSSAEKGTGYFKNKWFKEEISSDLATIKIENPNDHLAWGAAYWQYFEDLDKITFAETPLKLNKTLFKQIKTDKGFKIEPISNNQLKVGDKVIVRIELRVDRSMNYVHMKDMRSSGFEPVNVMSRYKYQDGLGYYESTRDASTNFFFDYLNEGTYVFEYPLKVYHKGDFSNGITSIQCMYAPEFTSHSEGLRVKVD